MALHKNQRTIVPSHVRLFSAAPCQLPTSNYQSATTNQQLPSNYQPATTNQPLPISNYQSATTNQQLPISHYQPAMHLVLYLFIFHLHLLLRLSTQHQHNINTTSTQHQHPVNPTSVAPSLVQASPFSHRLPVNQHLFLKNARLL